MAVCSPPICFSNALAIPRLFLGKHSLNSYSLEIKFWGERRKSALCLASSSQNSNYNVERKRKVVEHICLLRAKEDLSEEQEKDMLDYLYTSQYHMAGIVAISLGRTSDPNPENYSHGVFMRFQRKEDLAKFYENSLYMRVLKEHVAPYCHDLLNVDFEVEVEDDILAIFRKGEEFNYGVEFVLLIKFHESALNGPDALTSLANLAFEFPSLIVQSTQGCNFNPESKEYTHAIVIRFRSVEAQRIFLESSEYKHIWESKLLPMSQKILSFHFLVDPVGTDLIAHGFRQLSITHLTSSLQLIRRTETIVPLPFVPGLCCSFVEVKDV